MYKISIVVPVYGVENYLEKCLDSLYPQLTEDCQVVLVDDESPDKSGEICEDYKKRYPHCTTVIHQKNMGLGGARNTGMKAADGEYFFFLDSDDTIPEGTIETLLSAIDRFGADAYVFPYRSVGEDGSDLGVARDSLPTDTPLCAREHKEILVGTPNACNKLVRASLFSDNGVEFPSKVWYEDLRTMPKLLSKAESVVYLEKDMYNYLRREGSIMNNAKAERNMEIVDALEDLISWFMKDGSFETFREELEYLLIDHVLVSATVRIIRSCGTSHHLIKDFREYTFKNCPAPKKNKYVSSLMAGNRRLILKLLLAKLYFAVKLIFKIKK